MQDRVTPDPRHLTVWSAFFDLCGDRPAGMGFVGQIPFSAVDRYAARYGITDIDEFETFQSLLRVMDAAYVRRAADQIEAASRRR